jgi:cytochrome P450
VRGSDASSEVSAFACPAEFDVHRAGADEHLAFGNGLHYCLGASFGRIEAEIAIRERARRFPLLTLVPGQRLTFHPNISFRGPQRLIVRSG